MARARRLGARPSSTAHGNSVCRLAKFCGTTRTQCTDARDARHGRTGCGHGCVNLRARFCDRGYIWRGAWASGARCSVRALETAGISMCAWESARPATCVPWGLLGQRRARHGVCSASSMRSLGSAWRRARRGICSASGVRGLGSARRCAHPGICSASDVRGLGSARRRARPGICSAKVVRGQECCSSVCRWRLGANLAIRGLWHGQECCQTLAHGDVHMVDCGTAELSNQRIALPTNLCLLCRFIQCRNNARRSGGLSTLEIKMKTRHLVASSSTTPRLRGLLWIKLSGIMKTGLG